MTKDSTPPKNYRQYGSNNLICEYTTATLHVLERILVLFTQACTAQKGWRDGEGRTEGGSEGGREEGRETI